MPLSLAERLRFAGILFLLAGFILPFYVALPGLRISEWEQPPSTLISFVKPTFPAGTLDSPTPLEPGEEVAATVFVTTTISSQPSGSLEIWVNGELEATRSLSFTVNRAIRLATFYVWEGKARSWVVPHGKPEGTLIEFHFITTLQGDEKTARSYGVISEGPSGYFEVGTDVDGMVDVESVSTVEVSSSQLKFKFTATKFAEQIQQVDVRVKRENYFETVILTKTDGVWEGTHELPEPGTYTLQGRMYVGGEEYKLMEVALKYNVDEFPDFIDDVEPEPDVGGGNGGGNGEGGEPKLLNIFTVLGALCIAASFIVGRKQT